MKRALFLLLLTGLLLLMVFPVQAFAQDDITQFGLNVVVQEGEVQEGNVTVFGGNVDIEGTVEGNVTVIGGNLEIDGRVEGNVTNIDGNATLGEEAVITGNFTHYGGTLNRAPGAQIQGDETTGPRIFNPFANFISSLIFLLVALALAAVVVALFPEQTRVLANTVATQALPSFGYGFLATILVPVLFVLLALLIIVGWILIPFVAVAIPPIYFYGYVGVARWLGDRILGATRSAQQSPIMQALIGVLALGVLGFIPILGGLIQLVAAIIGLGAVLISKFGTGRPWRRERAVQPPPGEERAA